MHLLTQLDGVAVFSGLQKDEKITLITSRGIYRNIPTSRTDTQTIPSGEFKIVDFVGGGWGEAFCNFQIGDWYGAILLEFLGQDELADFKPEKLDGQMDLP